MKTIAQRELRNHSGKILRKVERGQRFAITVAGRPVAVLGPHRKGPWVTKDDYLGVLQAAPEDPTFFADIADMGSDPLDLDSRWQR